MSRTWTLLLSLKSRKSQMSCCILLRTWRVRYTTDMQGGGIFYLITYRYLQDEPTRKPSRLRLVYGVAEYDCGPNFVDAALPRGSGVLRARGRCPGTRCCSRDVMQPATAAGIIIISTFSGRTERLASESRNTGILNEVLIGTPNNQTLMPTKR